MKMQEWWQTEKLKCPSCQGQVTTIHPYYTAGDMWTELNSKNRWLTALFGPFSGLFVWSSSRKKALEADLYECKKCNIKFSFNDAKKIANT